MDEELRARTASDLYNKVGSLLTSLYSRWLNERDHEDIADYQKPLESSLREAGATAVKMLKRPFGFRCKIGDRIYQYGVTAHGVYFYRSVRVA